MGRFGRIALKTILWIIASVVFLVLLVVVLIQVPAVQNFAKNKAVTFLQNKIHTKVKIGHISLGLPKLLVLNDIYFEDQKRDTLIAGDKLKVDISMLKLLHHEVEINEINLQGITANVYRGKNSAFNFDYIIKAFAGEQKKESQPANTTPTMKFSIDKIILDRIHVKYKDLTTGNDFKFILGHFDARIKDFDLNKMKFTIPKINLSGVNAQIIQTPAGSSIASAAKTDTTAVKPLNMELALGIIDLSNINVVYRSTEMDANVNLNKFLVEIDKIDLKNQKVGIKSINLSDTYAGLKLNKPKTVTKTIVKTVKKLDSIIAHPQNTKGWSAILGRVTFSNDDIKFDNEAQAPIAKSLDFGHMRIHSLNADVENIYYSPDTVSGNINAFTFNEKSGLAIRKFHTKFFYGPKNAYLNDLLVETPNSVIQKQVRVSYPSLDAISKNIGALHISTNVDGSKISLKDILLLMPTMAGMEPFKHSPNAVFRIDGKVDGQVNNLTIPELEIRGLSNTHIKASARLRGLPDMKKAYFDVNLADFNTNAADIAKLAPAGSIPSNVGIPANMNLKGTFKGGLYNFNTKLNLRSIYGAMDLVASLKNGNDKNRATYAANIKANQLNVGALTKQPKMVGAVTLSANVKGAGLDPKKASLQFDGNVAQAYVKGYNYKNLLLKGTANNGDYTMTSTMKDTNISFKLDAKANLNKKYSSIKANLMLDSLNLQALHFSTEPMRVHGKVVADIPTADPDYLNADVKVNDLLVINKDQRIRIDSISLLSKTSADSSALRLKTPFMLASMSGKYKLTQVGYAMQDMINKYFDTGLGSAKPKAKPAYAPQQFTFSLAIV
ncbi:MAG TPA: hypothetical protein VNW51_01525, partial [Mucilaginibacter sp.]|nr:hypothetical protein [Mucilaginibacter sp.]